MQPKTRRRETAGTGAPNNSKQGVRLKQSEKNDAKPTNAKSSVSSAGNPEYFPMKSTTPLKSALVELYDAGFDGRCWI
jgi:hypothetical protein